MSNRKSKLTAKMVLRVVVLVSGTTWAFGSAFAVDYPEPGDITAGAQAWVENCTHCHNLRNPNELRDDQWITSMFHMRLKAGLTGKETRDIISFIQAANATAAQERIREEAEAASAAQQSEE
ncbi:MAG: cytochrome c [Gammaproteobacteria bacterium]